MACEHLRKKLWLVKLTRFPKIFFPLVASNKCIKRRNRITDYPHKHRAHIGPRNYNLKFE